MRRLALASVVLVAALSGCEDHSYRDIGSEINIAVKRSDALVQPALRRLVAFGHKAVPQIETALHTAAVGGRLNLVAALEAIGDDEAVPILRHFAAHDSKPEVRTACQAVLTRWAAAGQSRRGDRAREALARVADKRTRGEPAN